MSICKRLQAKNKLSIQDLDLLTIGMVNVMYAESGKDACQEEYAEMATQDEKDAF